MDKRTIKVFTVLSRVDLNMYPRLLEPCTVTGVKKFGFLFWESDPVIATLELRKGGFVPGESIVCDLTIENQSSRTLKYPYINLKQKIKINATAKSKIKVRKLTSAILEHKIAPRSIQKFSNACVAIPSTCASSLDTSRAIEISYIFELKFGASGLSSPESIEVPFVIGTVPIRGYDDSIDETQQSRYTLEASVFGAQTVAKAEKQPEDDAYKPFYPYYKNHICTASNSEINQV